MHTTTDLLDLIEQGHRRQRATIIGVVTAFAVLAALIVVLHGVDQRAGRGALAYAFRGPVASDDAANTVDANTVDANTVEAGYTPDTACLMATGGCNTPAADEAMRPRATVTDVADDDGIVYESNFSSGLADDWQPLSGSWKVENGALEEVLDCGYDYTAMLMTAPVANFRLETTFRSISGPNQGGVVIHQSSPDTRSGATLVDLAEGGTTLRWGTYDDQGYYRYTGSLPIQPVAPGETVTLMLEVQGKETTVLLNGLFVTRFENAYSSGLVGLVSTKSAVAFESVRLVNLPDAVRKGRDAIDGSSPDQQLKATLSSQD